MAHELFSNRDKPQPTILTLGPLTSKFKQQVLWIWKDSIDKSDRRNGNGQSAINPIFWRIDELICREHGLSNLGLDRNYPAWTDNVPKFLISNIDDAIVLDIIELSMKLGQEYADTGAYGLDCIVLDNAINDLNKRFRENGFSYVYDRTARMLIRADNLVTHQEVIEPTLLLLAATQYSTANSEYLEAHKDYRNGKFGDCLTKCCSAFESVMKVICKRNNWIPERETDISKAQAQSLIRTILSNTGLPFSVFEQPLIGIATMRNKLGTAHGGGETDRQPSDYIARYALNATGSAMLLVHDAQQS